MSLIDWSDPEEMVSLLVEYVADERNEARNDPERRQFLAKLSCQLESLEDRFSTLSLSEGIESLRRIYAAEGSDYMDDPVIGHLQACVEELERIDASPSALSMR